MRFLEKKLYKWFAFSITPFVILSIVNCFTNVHMLPTVVADECDSTTDTLRTFTSVFWISWHLLEAIVLLVFLRLLKNVWKEFSIMKELTQITLICGLFSICFAVFLLLRYVNSDKFPVDISYLVLSRGAAFFLVTIVWPTYRTYFRIDAPAFPSRTVLSSLGKILTDQAAMKYFTEFMRFNKTDDLLTFWMEVDMFRGEHEVDEDYSVAQTEEVRKEAQAIMYKYFTSDHNEGNANFQAQTVVSTIDGHTAEMIRRTIQNEDSYGLGNVFDEAQAQVYNRMDRSEYQLFLNSCECKELISMIRTQEIVFEKLIAGRII